MKRYQVSLEIEAEATDPIKILEIILEVDKKMNDLCKIKLKKISPK